MSASGRDGGGDERPGNSPSDDDAALGRRLRNLQGKLQERRARETAEQAVHSSAGSAGMGAALRLGGEFVAGVMVGAGLGWLFDRFLGTSPWGLIVFVLLGFGAGLLNVLRLAGVVDAPALPPKEKSGDDRPDKG